jgi:hypothetical protein
MQLCVSRLQRLMMPQSQENVPNAMTFSAVSASGVPGSSARKSQFVAAMLADLTRIPDSSFPMNDFCRCVANGNRPRAAVRSHSTHSVLHCKPKLMAPHILNTLPTCGVHGIRLDLLPPRF